MLRHSLRLWHTQGMPEASVTPEDIDRLLALVADVDALEGDYMTRRDPRWPEYREPVERLFIAFTHEPWGLPDYSPEAAAVLRDEPRGIETATLDELRELLTAAARSERFYHGSWDALLRDGTIDRALRRLAQLRDQLQG